MCITVSTVILQHFNGLSSHNRRVIGVSATEDAPDSHCAGFTLLELMVVIAIVAIFVTLALPGFTGSIRRNSVMEARDALVHSLSMARSEAVVKKIPVIVCAGNPNSGCGGSWADGWIVFGDADYSGSYSAANDVLVDTRYLPEQLVINGVPNQLEFMPTGIRRAAGDVRIVIRDVSGSSEKTFNLAMTGAVQLQ